MADSLLSHYRRNKGLLGTQVLYRAQVPSTNTLLLEAGERGLPEGFLALADFQIAGRGRLSRKWVAPAGTCLLMSLLFRPLPPFNRSAAYITMVCGIALADAVREVTGLSVWIKWPNDLIVTRGDNWRKVAGILSEVGMVGRQPDFLVAGIGLNVNVSRNMLPELDPLATSLQAETGRTFSRVVLLDAFLERADVLYAQVRDGWSPHSLWVENLAWLGKAVQVSTPTENLTGIAEGVELDGSLLLRLTDGTRRCFSVGDVSLRI